MSNHAPKIDLASKLMFLVSVVAILLVVYILLNSLVNTYQKNKIKGEMDNSYLVEAASDNLMPIGVSSTSDTPVATNAAGRGGKEIYDAVCTSCHATGVLGSPKFGDKAAWEKRSANGLDTLIASAIKGKGSMPAKGGDPSLSDAEIKAVILYMTKESGLDLGGVAPEAKKEEAEEKKEKEKEEVVEAPAKAESPKATPEPATPKAPEVITDTPEASKEVAEAPAKEETPTVSAATLAAGKKVYDTVCFACHATGVAGAPKLGNKDLWTPRIATGADSMYNTALKGKGAMPPKGGNMSLSDEDVKAAVDYMVSKVQ